jgi:1-acyl-sn-glycerol-3-phosphate acyltransferase
MPKRSLWHRFYYRFWWLTVRLILLVMYRVRVFDERHVPMTGGAMLLANHQSHFDPPSIGAVVRRRLNFLARKTLFKGPFKWHISWLDAIPIDQEGVGASGIKETLRRLKNSEAVLIFPEGSRSLDGQIQPIMPGFCALVRRCRVPLVPVGIAGAFEAWPRTAPYPKLRGAIHIRFGPPLMPAESAKYNDAQLIAEIDRRIRDCFEQARATRRRAMDAML